MSDIIKALKQHRFIIGDEKNLQLQIEEVIKENGIIAYHKEHILSSDSIIDFFLKNDSSGIGIEVKVNGTRRRIYNQLCRYAEHTDIDKLVLITTLSMGLPERIGNKPVTVINLSRAWL